MLFPPALKYFGIDPDKIISIQLSKEKDILWTMEEALKCNGLAAYLQELPRKNLQENKETLEKKKLAGTISGKERKRYSGLN